MKKFVDLHGNEVSYRCCDKTLEVIKLKQTRKRRSFGPKYNEIIAEVTVKTPEGGSSE
jgi:hypothetical protein